jgi:hypothetical protein
MKYFFFGDLLILFKMLLKKKYRICFFNENKFTLKYLKHYIEKKRSEKILLITFEELDENFENTDLYHLRTNFFRQLVFLILDARLVYSTTPGLNETVFRRSILNKKTKYIYIQHSPVSLTKAYNENSFNNFDYLQSINIFQTREIHSINSKYNLKIKDIKSKYYFINNQQKKLDSKKVLIAPTWGTDFYEMNFLIDLLSLLKRENLNFIFRPHYMSLKRKEFNPENFENFNQNFDYSPNLNLSEYSDLISDWSGIYMEFCLTNNRKCFLINTKQKIINKKNFCDYLTIEESLRDQLSHVYDKNKIHNMVNKIKNDKLIEPVNHITKNFFY